MNKIVMYGSGCCPPHLGHKKILEDLSSLGFDEVKFVPVGMHMFGKQLIDDMLRLEFARCVTNSMSSNIVTSDYEIMHRSGMTPTCETLEYFQEQNPESELAFAIGADNLKVFAKWKNWQFLAENYQIVIYRREGHEIEERDYILLDQMKSYIIRPTTIDISSSQIRKWFKEGNAEKAKPFLEPVVYDYLLNAKIFE